jgi:hypothetical protein
MIKLDSKNNGESYKVYYENGAYLGDFEKDMDGYYKFWPELKGGFWDEHILRLLADKLTELNKDWDNIIRNDPRLK